MSRKGFGRHRDGPLSGGVNDRLRGIAAGALIVALIVTVGYALRPHEASRRKTLGEVVALELYAGMDQPPNATAISPAQDTSSAAPGRPGGYRRAVMFHDPLLSCPKEARPVSCGAKLEIFRRRTSAIERAASLADSTDETVVRRGALLLRITSDLPTSRRALYRSQFVTAVNNLTSFRDLARLDR